MYSKEVAQKVKERVEKELVFLAIDDKDMVRNTQMLVYFYPTEEERTKHIELMKKAGWSFDEDQSITTSIYASFNFERDTDYIEVYIGRFFKAIEE